MEKEDLQKLINLVNTHIPVNIELAFQLAKGRCSIQDLCRIYEQTFRHYYVYQKRPPFADYCIQNGILKHLALGGEELNVYDPQVEEALIEYLKDKDYAKEEFLGLKRLRGKFTKENIWLDFRFFRRVQYLDLECTVIAEDWAKYRYSWMNLRVLKLVFKPTFKQTLPRHLKLFPYFANFKVLELQGVGKQYLSLKNLSTACQMEVLKLERIKLEKPIDISLFPKLKYLHLESKKYVDLETFPSSIILTLRRMKQAHVFCKMIKYASNKATLYCRALDNEYRLKLYQRPASYAFRLLVSLLPKASFLYKQVQAVKHKRSYQDYIKYVAEQASFIFQDVNLLKEVIKEETTLEIDENTKYTFEQRFTCIRIKVYAETYLQAFKQQKNYQTYTTL